MITTQLLTHELIHSMQPLNQEAKEKDAYGKQDKLNFFEN